MTRTANSTTGRRAGTAIAVLAIAVAFWWLARSDEPPAPIASPPVDAAADGASSIGASSDDRESLPEDPAAATTADDANAVADAHAATGTASVAAVPAQLRIRIHGKVSDQRGRRIPGATVKLWARQLPPRTTIASGGEYEFEIDWRLDSDYLRIDAWADGYAADDVQIAGINPFAAKATDIERDVVLGPGHTIVGRAIAESGPVFGAFATCWQLDGKRVGYFAYSDPEGRFAMKVAAGQTVDRVVVRHGRFGQGDAIVPQLRTGGVADVGDVVLAAANTVRGRLVTPSGRGLANVPVTISVRDVSKFDDVHGMAFTVLTTDGGGAFAANGIAPGPCLVTIRSAMIARFENMAGDWGATERTVVVDGARVGVTFEWNGAPVPPSLLEIDWLPPEGEWTGPAVTDSADDRLVPFDSSWIVRAAFFGGQARGETRIEVGRQEQVRCVVHLR